MAYMSRVEAGREAVRKWGSDGWASTRTGTCQVGIGHIVAGDALSWEDAFEMADDSPRMSGYLRMCGQLEQAKCRAEVGA